MSVEEGRVEATTMVKGVVVTLVSRTPESRGVRDQVIRTSARTMGGVFCIPERTKANNSAPDSIGQGDPRASPFSAIVSIF
jgi:hypothetical protein